MKMKWNKSKKSKKKNKNHKTQKNNERKKRLPREYAPRRLKKKFFIKNVTRNRAAIEVNKNWKQKQTNNKKTKNIKTKKEKKPLDPKSRNPSFRRLTCSFYSGGSWDVMNPNLFAVGSGSRWYRRNWDRACLLLRPPIRAGRHGKGCCMACSTCSTSRDNPMEHTTCTVPLPVKWWSTIAFCGRERFWSWFSFCVCVWFMFVRLRSVMWTSLGGQMDDRNESTLVVWEDNFGAALWEFPPPIT